MSSRMAQPVIERSQVRIAPLSELTVPKVDQRGPEGSGEFTYVAISSIDNRLKKIVDPKHLPVTVAPSRARQRLKAGDVIVSMTRPNLNAVALVPPEFDVLRATDGINCRWIYYAVQTSEFVRDMSQLVQGALYPAVRPKDIRRYQIPVPDEKQQREIVGEIEKQFSRLDEAVANLKRVKANLKRYKAAVLKAAVEGKLTEEWRKAHPDVEQASELLKRILAERRARWKEQSSSRYRNKYVEPQPPDTFNLPRLPEGWTWASCEQICDFITKGTTPASSKLREGKGEVRFLKVYNLTFTGILDYNHNPAFVDRVVHEGELARSKVQTGDVLINIVGPPLGQVSLVPSEIAEANINQAIARFRPIPGILGKFLALVLMTESIMSWAISRAKTTAGQANLTLELCRELPIPIVPIGEQHRIVAEVERCLSITAEAEVQIDDNLKRGERLRQSILQRAFSGKLLAASSRSREAQLAVLLA
jgi:type I restriction enzyme S subunit